MTVVIDTTVLLYFLNRETRAPLDPATGLPITQCGERIDLLIQALSKSRERIIIPAPVLAEVFTKAQHAAPGYLAAIQNQTAFKLVPFDTLCAIETAEIRSAVLGNDRDKFANVPRAKLKYDVLIMATAKVHGAQRVYSDDGDLKTLGKTLGVGVLGIADLPPPEEDLFGPVPTRRTP